MQIDYSMTEYSRSVLQTKKELNMFKSILFLSVLAILPWAARAQLPSAPQDLSFDQCDHDGQALPGWMDSGASGYDLQCKSVNPGPAYWSAQISANPGHGDFAAITQCLNAANYIGQVGFAGWLKTSNVANGYAGLWFRADAADGHVVAFDNMYDRGVTGTTDFNSYQISLVVPPNAVRICYGALLTGDGSV